MTFISYAQNFEDVMLWRALCKVKNGFYIDAGAWSPDEDSVTRAFYEHGWRGLNVEPNPVWFEKLREKRPEDINLNFALSDKIEILDFHIIVGVTGLSTIDFEHAEQNKKEGRSIQVIPCQATTLSEIWDKNVKQKQVHFLKIDVEGAEELVLRGNDWMKNRPWVVLIESVLPNTQVTTHHLWEHFLIDADYLYIYSDGINRYYVAKEHSDLVASFAYPPNIFDQFKLSSHVQADENVIILTHQYEEVSKQYRDMSQQYHALSQQYQALSQRYQDLESQHLVSVQILSGLRQTRIYHLIRKLGLWNWLEEGILNLAYFQVEAKKDAG